MADMLIDPPYAKPTPKWAMALVHGANSRNRQRGSAERFTLADLIALWTDCGGRCAVSGLAFQSLMLGDGKAKRPFYPSLDRIDRHRPYIRENVRLVVSMANFAMNAWGLEPLVELAAAISAMHGQVTPSLLAATAAAVLPVALQKGDGAARRGRGRSKKEKPLTETEELARDLSFPARATMKDGVQQLLAAGPKRSRDMENALAKRFQISARDRQVKLRSGCPVWRNWLAWALADLAPIIHQVA